jgi:adenylate cyclase
MKGILARRARRVLLGCLLSILTALSILQPQPFGIFQFTDRVITDAQMRLASVKLDDRIIIVDIDEPSLAAHGRWPWSRHVVSDLIDKLHENGKPKVIAFDVLFAEAEDSNDLKIIDRLAADPNFQPMLAQLQKLRIERDADARLRRTLEGKPVVLGFYFTAGRQGYKSGQLPPSLMQSEALAAQGWQLLSWSGYGANLRQFIEVAHGGFYSPRVDSDGLVRELPLLGDYEGQAYESLVSVVLRLYTGSAIAQFTSEGLLYQSSEPKKSLLLPLTPEMTAVIPFAGRGGARGGRFLYVSATDVLNGVVDWSKFKDRIVLVGTTALGLTDLRATPVNPSFPGVETHAALISGALDGAINTRTPVGPMLMALLALGGGAILSLRLTKVGAVGVVVVGVLSLASLLIGHTIARLAFGWLLPVGALLALVFALVLINLVTGYVMEGRSRKAVVERFGEYVAPELVARMADDPTHYKMDSENKELTILFADIRGFTPIAESLSPQDLREFLNRFLGTMSDIIHEHHGTVDKYMGDAVMAFWGAPVNDPDHANHAVAAGIAMLKAAERLNEEFSKRGWPNLAIGVGINTGIVRVGDMGTSHRRAYTVIGDAVNLAARIESLTKHLRAPLALGERTVALAKQFECVSLGTHRVAGKVDAIEVFCPQGVKLMPERVLHASQSIVETTVGGNGNNNSEVAINSKEVTL